MDLLNKILVADEANRITVPEIEAHPWYCQPLSERLARAEAAITAEQLQLDDVQKEARISTVRPGTWAQGLARGATV